MKITLTFFLILSFLRASFFRGICKSLKKGTCEFEQSLQEKYNREKKTAPKGSFGIVFFADYNPDCNKLQFSSENRQPISVAVKAIKLAKIREEEDEKKLLIWMRHFLSNYLRQHKLKKKDLIGEQKLLFDEELAISTKHKLLDIRRERQIKMQDQLVRVKLVYKEIHWLKIYTDVENEKTLKYYDCYFDETDNHDTVFLIMERLYTPMDPESDVSETKEMMTRFYRQDSIVKLRTLRSISRQLELLHVNDLVFNDLKPENIMFVNDKSFDAKLIDLGGLEDENKNWKVGSKLFLDHESLEDDLSKKEKDIWALGLTFAEILLNKSVSEAAYINSTPSFFRFWEKSHYKQKAIRTALLEELKLEKWTLNFGKHSFYNLILAMMRMKRKDRLKDATLVRKWLDLLVCAHDSKWKFNHIFERNQKELLENDFLEKEAKKTGEGKQCLLHIMEFI